MVKILLLAVLLSMNDRSDKKLRFVRSTKIDSPSKVSVDQAGNIYVADQTGNLFLFDPEGTLQSDYSPPHPARISLLEAWQGLRIFLFFRDLQQYAFLNRFLINPKGNYDFSNTGFVEMAAPSSDNNIWLIDQTDFSMKKYLIFQQQTGSSTPFDLLLDPEHYEIDFIKEYQNKVFVADKNSGILLFDNFGNFIKKYNQPGLKEFNFFDNYLYFIDKSQIVLIDLYNDNRQTVPLPAAKNYRHLIVFGDRYYLFDENGMDIYHLSP